MAKETALITGASSGIGLEFARLFAADGSDLVIVARREERLKEIAEELEAAHGVKVHVLAKDLTKPKAPEEIFSYAKKEKIQIDVLVNNAGFGLMKVVSETDKQILLDMIQLNITALTHLTKLFLTGIQERGHGGILNVGSLAGFQPGPNLAVYFASKAYVLSFTEALAEENENPNIKISCFAPGPVRTEFGDLSELSDSLLFKMSLMDSEPAVKAGYEGFRKGQIVIIPGLKQQIVPFMNRFTPRFMIRKIAKKLNTKVS